MSIFDRLAGNLMKGKLTDTAKKIGSATKFSSLSGAALDAVKKNKLTSSVVAAGGLAEIANALSSDDEDKMKVQLKTETAALESGKGTPEERKQWENNTSFIKRLLASKEQS